MENRTSYKSGKITRTIKIEKYDSGDSYSVLARFIEMETPELPTIGKKYFVWSSTYVGPNYSQRDTTDKIRFSDDAEMIETGMIGNSNRTIRRFHGWRGTTDDVSVHAHGVRTCENIIRTEYAKTVHYKIIFGADEAANRD